MQAMGIDAISMLRETNLKTWISITAHGRDGNYTNRIGFGDDVAVAGGLVASDSHGPVFLGDAIGDPLTGAVAGLAGLLASRSNNRMLLDVAMARVCAAFATPL
jgi:crotonobetainyl-CoA:carnitine CoA-transferase CaiB-like acyl-CoA transferase